MGLYIHIVIHWLETGFGCRSDGILGSPSIFDAFWGNINGLSKTLRYKNLFKKKSIENRNTISILEHSGTCMENMYKTVFD